MSGKRRSVTPASALRAARRQGTESEGETDHATILLYARAMTTTRSDTLRLERAPISWGLMLAATLLAGVTIALVWFAAVPWGPIVCPAIYPAPRNCFASDRAGTALVVTIVLLAVYLATVATALINRRGRRLAITGVILLAIAPVISYLSVAWIPGFPLS